MPASKSAKLPPIIPLSELLRMKRLPAQAPIIYLTNAQWRTWNRRIASAARKVSARKAAKAKSKPRVTLEVTPMPSLKGYLIRIVPATPRTKITLWRPKELPLCISIGVRPRGRLRPGLTCGFYFNVCTRQITCGGTCPLIRPPGGIPILRSRCMPIFKTIPERHYLAYCLCVPIP